MILTPTSTQFTRWNVRSRRRKLWQVKRSGLAIPIPLLALSWFPCCREEAPTACTICDGLVPNDVELTLASIRNFNGLCADCADFNNTYTLTRGAVWRAGGDGGCCWTYTFPDTICGSRRVGLSVWVDTSESDYLATAWVTITGGCSDVNINEALWEKNYGASKPDCWNWVNEDLPLHYEWWANRCEGVDSTCKITAV